MFYHGDRIQTGMDMKVGGEMCWVSVWEKREEGVRVGGRYIQTYMHNQDP